MKVGRVAILKELERGRSANSSERGRPVAVTVAVHVHVRLRAVGIWSNQGAMRV